MVFSHNAHLNPQQVFLKSNEYTILNNSSKKSSITFDLKTSINIPLNVDAYIQLNSFKFINSFYNINSTNNNFYFSLNGGVEDINIIYEINIPIGNYSITSLVTYLNTELTSFIVVVFNNATFKLSFTSDTYTFIIRDGVNSCLKLIGFTDTTIETNDLNSTNLINLSGTQVLYVSLGNIHISSNSSVSSKHINVLESVNVDVLPGSSKSYYNSSSLKYKIAESYVSRIDVNIFDENGLLVDFNNTDWFMSISFIFSYKNEYKPPPQLDLIESSTNDMQDDVQDDVPEEPIKENENI
jgi:hypothetical protein